MKLKFRKKKSRLINVLIVVVLLVSIITTFLFRVFNKKINPRVVEITEQNLNKITYSIIMDYLDSEILNQEYLDNILIITKNKDSEIVTVDFNLEQAYTVLSEITRRMEENLNELESGKIKIDYYDSYLSNSQNGLVLKIPIGVASNNAYFNNLGPKIPVKIKFIGTLLTNLKTKITNYGMNNALVELYAYIMITEEVTTPVTFKELKTEYDVLISAKMVNGRVPTIYGNSLESESSLFNIPIK